MSEERAQFMKEFAIQKVSRKRQLNAQASDSISEEIMEMFPDLISDEAKYKKFVAPIVEELRSHAPLLVDIAIVNNELTGMDIRNPSNIRPLCKS